MGSTAESIRAAKNKAARAFTAGVLACALVAMPAIAQSPQADFNAGKSYHDGDGIPQDFVRARSLYERAANYGNTDAMINLGYMYYVGQGVAQDYDKARDWYIRADRLGNPSARENLQGLYSRGLSSPPTLTEISAPETAVSEEAPVVEDTTPAELGLESPMPEPEPEPLPKPETAPDEILTPSLMSDPLETPNPVKASELPAETAPASDIYEPVTPDALDELRDRAKPSLQTPALHKSAFNFAKLTPYLLGLLALFVLLLIIGMIRFITRAQRRFVESFTQAHDYGLRRMYGNFLQTAQSDSNHDIWMRGVSDMMVRYAHDESVVAAHARQALPLQEAAKDSQEAARIASKSLTLRAKALIVKSYSRLGAPE